MGWRDLLQTEGEKLTTPWTGGRELRREFRTWDLIGQLPLELGWFEFNLAGRKATVAGPVEPDPELLRYSTIGYLVGDRLVPDGIRVDPDPTKIFECSRRVWLLEPGLDRFVRISAGRTYEGGPLVYKTQEMPFGPENEVLQAHLDRCPSVDHIPGVTPALDAAFRMEKWRREEAERRRQEAERRRQEEEERRAIEEKRRHLVQQLGDGRKRREMARLDFDAAARAALAISGAELLDSRLSNQRNEMVVRFRLQHRQFECTCDANTLQIIDAGVCLVGNDAFFTLESLPGVIQEAERRGVLHVFRHVGDEDD